MSYLILEWSDPILSDPIPADVLDIPACPRWQIVGPRASQEHYYYYI